MVEIPRESRVSLDAIFSTQNAEAPENLLLPDGDYREFLRDRDPGMFRPGAIVDREGRTLGRHTGVANFTIGQKKGLGLQEGRRLYVLDLDPDRDTVTVGEAHALDGRRLTARSVNFIACEPPTHPLRVEARIRHNHVPAPANVSAVDADSAEVVFDTPQRAITPGQSVVWYPGDLVVGGGVIAR